MSKYLRDNIGSIIALIWTIASVAIFTILIYQGDKSIKDTIQNIIILILGYYYGSTRVMNDKIRAENEKNTTNNNNSNQSNP